MHCFSRSIYGGIVVTGTDTHEGWQNHVPTSAATTSGLPRARTAYVQEMAYVVSGIFATAQLLKLSSCCSIYAAKNTDQPNEPEVQSRNCTLRRIREHRKEDTRPGDKPRLYQNTSHEIWNVFNHKAHLTTTQTSHLVRITPRCRVGEVSQLGPIYFRPTRYRVVPIPANQKSQWLALRKKRNSRAGYRKPKSFS